MSLNKETRCYSTILDAIGETPLVKLNKIPQEQGIKANIYVKAEYLNSGGSSHDRFALRLVQLAEEKGVISEGKTIVFACAYNVAIGMAVVCAVKGYRLVIVTAAREEADIDTLLTSLGAEVLRCNDNMCPCLYAKNLNLPNSVYLNEFEKKVFPEAVGFKSGEEIFSALDKVSLVVAPFGHGAHNIKSKAPSGTKVIVAKTVIEHKGGHGVDHYPFLETGTVDSQREVSSKDAFLTARRLIREEGVMCGVTSGASVHLALELAKDLSENDNVVVLLGDGIRNYMNTFIDDEWLQLHGVIDEVKKPVVKPNDNYDPNIMNTYDPTTLAGKWEKAADGTYTDCSRPFKPFRAVRPPILHNILEAVGNTPLVKLNKVPGMYGVKCNIYAKCEFLNAGGSIKDRIALRMVELAEQDGTLKPGMTLIEPTSGNTGIGLALAAAVKGYGCIICMPQKMSKEKALAMEALGAIIVRTPNSAGYNEPISHMGVALRLQNELPGGIILDQYRNMGNPMAHYEQTAEEIIAQTGGKVDAVVVGAGTGGSVTGIGMKIKDKVPGCIVVGTDPVGSILADPNDKTQQFYEVEGVGYDFLPGSLKRDVVDRWVKTMDKESFEVSRALIRHEGLLCGGSSGANVWSALQIAKDLPETATVVVVLPDGVRNYLSKFLDNDWMSIRGLLSTKTD